MLVDLIWRTLCTCKGDLWYSSVAPSAREGVIVTLCDAPERVGGRLELPPHVYEGTEPVRWARERDWTARHVGDSAVYYLATDL